MSSALAAFLRARRNPETWLAPSRTLHVFLGNEASDADSIVSSICMAFLKQQTLPEDAHWCAPWVQCKRGELKVRAETDALLRRAGLDPDWLVYQDEWQLPESPEEAGTAVAINLLDHNAMSPGVSRNLPWAPSAVEGIWDHHEDHGLHKSAAVREVAFDAAVMSGIGSCCTLVAEAAIAESPGALEGGDSPLALALLGVVLLDTACLSESAGKAKPRDHAAAESLAAACGMDGGASGAAARALFDDLSARKFSPELWASLTLPEVVGADFKATRLVDADGSLFVVGYASVLAPLDAVLLDGPPEETHRVLRQVCADRGLSVLALLGLALSGDPPSPSRELAVFAPAPSGGGGGAAAGGGRDPRPVLEASAASLGASLVEPGPAGPYGHALMAGRGADGPGGVGASEHGCMGRWSQGDATASRKQLRPALDRGLRAWLGAPPAARL